MSASWVLKSSQIAKFLPMMELQPIHEQDVYTVNYGTQNLLSSGGKATSYILGLCVHYLVLECSYL